MIRYILLTCATSFYLGWMENPKVLLKIESFSEIITSSGEHRRIKCSQEVVRRNDRK